VQVWSEDFSCMKKIQHASCYLVVLASIVLLVMYCKGLKII
jgi:hypothetical protein